MVPERVVVEDEVAVPGLSLDIVGDPLVEAADECGASGENVSMVGNQMEDRMILGQAPAARLRRWEGWEGQKVSESEATGIARSLMG